MADCRYRSFKDDFIPKHAVWWKVLGRSGKINQAEKAVVRMMLDDSPCQAEHVCVTQILPQGPRCFDRWLEDSLGHVMAKSANGDFHRACAPDAAWLSLQVVSRS
jgi:hypothetical protein